MKLNRLSIKWIIIFCCFFIYFLYYLRTNYETTTSRKLSPINSEYINKTTPFLPTESTPQTPQSIATIFSKINEALETNITGKYIDNNDWLLDISQINSPILQKTQILISKIFSDNGCSASYLDGAGSNSIIFNCPNTNCRFDYGDRNYKPGQSYQPDIYKLLYCQKK